MRLALVRPHFQEQTWQAFWKIVVEGKRLAKEEVAIQPETVRVGKSRVLQRLRQEVGKIIE